MHGTSIEIVLIAGVRIIVARKRDSINYNNNKFYHIDLPPLNRKTKWLISAFTSLVV